MTRAIRNNFFGDMNKMYDEMSRLYNRMLYGGEFLENPLLENWKSSELSPSSIRTPKADIQETEGSVIANFEIPGVNKKDIELNVTEDEIEVNAQKFAEKEVKEKETYSYTGSTYQYYRKIPLPASVKSDEAKAEYKDGILKVEIPKLRRENKKKISIQ